MRKLKIQMQITIDGFVAGPNGENDWVFISGPDEAGFREIIDLAASSDTLLLGRKLSQEGFIGHWETCAESQADTPQKTLGQLIVNMRKIVFTPTDTAISGRNVEVENGNLANAVQALKKQPGKDILVYGGVDFVNSLTSLNLIDEYFFFICPVAIGNGPSILRRKKS